MAHRLEPRAGEPYLSPAEIVRRLEGEFGYVDADAEAGQNDVASMIRQFERMKAPRTLIDEHRAMQIAAIHLVVSDSSDFVNDYLSFAALPGQGLLIGYHSHQHEETAWPLVQRCCSALGYEPHLV